MRAARFVIALIAFAACGGKPGKSICDNAVPPPAACMSQCDPSPSAPNTCPSGYHCAADGFCDALCTPGGNECGDGYTCTSDGRCKGDDECVGLECNITACQAKGMPETSISGTVYAPNGTLPLYGITVYIPNQPLPAMPDGAQCSRCSDDLPGQPLARATTDDNGKFVIQGNVPSGTDIPLVIVSGKWRRQIKIAAVGECADTVAPAMDTRLPKTKAEGDIPKIAITTGSADSLECLIRKLGVDDTELTISTGAGRVHLFHGNGVDAFKAGWPGGAGSMTESTAFWTSVNNLKPYDIVILSCEGDQMGSNKTQGDLNAMRDYADLGGRVFASHWHNVWIGGYFHTADGGNANNPDPVLADWRQVAQWSQGANLNTDLVDLIDEQSNPKGVSFANWMKVVEPSIPRGDIPIINTTGRTTANSIDPAKAERWTSVKGGTQPQNFQFTTPQNVSADQRCGKVVFSDMHVSGGPGTGDYPDSCNNGPLTPQEKALAFMIFDLSSCVGVLL